MEINNASSVHVSTTSSAIINTTSVGVAGLQPKSKVAPTLITNFGFILIKLQ